MTAVNVPTKKQIIAHDRAHREALERKFGGPVVICDPKPENDLLVQACENIKNMGR